MRNAISAIVVWSTVGASTVLALGSDYSKEDLQQRGVLVKDLTPVHGYWVNSEDVFFYSGETAAFNKFVEAYGKEAHLKLQVVIHTGTKKARSPWDKADRDIPVDWSYYVWNTSKPDPKKPAPSRVDVWLGGRIKLDDLRIPEHIEVVGPDEIKKQIEERRKSKK